MNIRSIKEIKGIGDKTALLFEKLGIKTMDDLMVFFPYKYIQYDEVSTIDKAVEGCTLTVRAHVIKPITNLRLSRTQLTITKIQDDTGTIDVNWFHMPYLSKSIHMYDEYIFVGKPIKSRGKLTLSHPKLYKTDEYMSLIGHMKPVYNLTSGLSNNSVSKAVTYVLDKMKDIDEYMPDEIIKRYNLLTYDKAIRNIHYPDSKLNLLAARHRLAFDDFFMFLFYTRMIKDKTLSLKSNYIIDTKETVKEYLDILPFTLTDAQIRAIEDINKDISSGYVADRLIQGDVGSGKTVVSAAALYEAYRAGYQAAIMVPTEILAHQHMETLSKLFLNASHKPKLLLLTGSMTEKEKKEAHNLITDHKVDIVIGTHALISDKVEFDELAVVITDEQHRFGVAQRNALISKGSTPHTIVMSATPIPRTLAVILYGDLDISIIDSKPIGRLEVKNCVIEAKDRNKAYKHIISEISAGHQAYIVCPMVEPNEEYDDNLENVIDYTENLKKTIGNQYIIKCLHGRMLQRQKDEIMNEFYLGHIDILVSTTVIEVGVDVPNATVMMIENAERFGLASLHQLRGRIGRGKSQSYCIFVRTSESEQAKKRLDIINHSNDGFYIASEDLKIRGPGELFGLSQSGDMRFSIADMNSDEHELEQANEACDLIKNKKIIIDNSKNKAFYDKLNNYALNLQNNMNL